MATDDRQVLVTGQAAAPAGFLVPGNGQIKPKVMNAVFDGTGASGVFLPTLEIVSDAGIIVARVPATQVSQGGTAEVTWAPFLEADTAAQGGPPGFGCVRFVGPPTGVAATDTAAIQAAHDSLPTSGGIVQLCRGTYQLTSGGLTFTVPIELTGHGRSVGTTVSPATVSPTTLAMNSSTGTAITVSATNPGVILRDFTLLNTSGVTPTAGAGIHVTAGAAGSGSQLLGVSVYSFYECVVFDGTSGWIMQRCRIVDYVLRGVRIDNTVNGDQGDMQILGNFFFTGPNNVGAVNSITWNGAGGLRCIGNKFNGPAPGNSNSSHIIVKYLEAADTGVILIQGNSLENVGDGIQVLSNAGSGTCHGIIVANNEIFATVTCVNINPALSGVYAAIVVSSNVMENATNGLIMGNVDSIVNGGNAFLGITNAVVVNAGVTNHTQYGIG